MLGFYDPLVGRFTSPDPIKDVSSANAVNPYVYCANNPLAYTDRFGLDKERPAPSPGYEGGDGGGGGGGRLTEPGNSGNPQAAGPLNALQWLGNKVSSLNIACVAAQAQAMDFMLCGAVGDTGSTLFLTSKGLEACTTNKKGDQVPPVMPDGTYDVWKGDVAQDVEAGGGTAEFVAYTPEHLRPETSSDTRYVDARNEIVDAIRNTDTIKSGGQFDRLVVLGHGTYDSYGPVVGGIKVWDLFSTFKSNGFLKATATIHIVACKVRDASVKLSALENGSIRWNAFAHPGDASCTNNRAVKAFIKSTKGSYNYLLNYERRHRYENM